jgi:hypothetical protein
MAKGKKSIDWGPIETDYCQGVMGVREIARWHGISHPALLKRAKLKGWVRKAARIETDAAAAAAPKQPRPADTAGVADRARGLAGRMIDELDAVTAHHGELEDMIGSEESDPRRRGALLKAISLGERAMTLKNISQTLKTLNEAADVGGKKAQRQANADKSASGGKFAVPSGPKLAVDNT